MGLLETSEANDQNVQRIRVAGQVLLMTLRQY